MGICIYVDYIVISLKFENHIILNKTIFYLLVIGFTDASCYSNFDRLSLEMRTVDTLKLTKGMKKCISIGFLKIPVSVDKNCPLIHTLP